MTRQMTRRVKLKDGPCSGMTVRVTVVGGTDWPDDVVVLQQGWLHTYRAGRWVSATPAKSDIVLRHELQDGVYLHQDGQVTTDADDTTGGWVVTRS